MSRARSPSRSGSNNRSRSLPRSRSRSLPRTRSRSLPRSSPSRNLAQYYKSKSREMTNSLYTANFTYNNAKKRVRNFLDQIRSIPPKYRSKILQKILDDNPKVVNNTVMYDGHGVINIGGVPMFIEPASAYDRGMYTMGRDIMFEDMPYRPEYAPPTRISHDMWSTNDRDIMFEDMPYRPEYAPPTRIAPGMWSTNDKDIMLD
jgi:hypothetical protein